MYNFGCQLIKYSSIGGMEMVSKQSVWFTFLFSIILVLSIFYVSMNENSLSDFTLPEDEEETSLVVNESTELVALRVQSDEEVMETTNDLQNILLSETTDLESKNSAYDELLTISNNKSIEEKLEKIVKEEFKYDSFIKVNGNNVTIVIDSDKSDYKIANDIIRMVRTEFKEDKYITVKFN